LMHRHCSSTFAYRGKLQTTTMISLTSQTIRLNQSKFVAGSRSRQGVARIQARAFKAPARAQAGQTDIQSSFQSKVSATATAALITTLSSPLAAEAAITPSLKNTLLSVLAGGVVLGAIAAAVIGVSSFDKVTRK